MAYSIHGHISYILEANYKRPNDFSSIGKKPNEILQFKYKKTYGIAMVSCSRFNLEFMVKGSKTKEIMKESKNRTGSKNYISFSLRINKQVILMYCDNREIFAKKILFLAVLYVLSIALT